jgi:hypothetical protein
MYLQLLLASAAIAGIVCIFFCVTPTRPEVVRYHRIGTEDVIDSAASKYGSVDLTVHSSPDCSSGEEDDEEFEKV